MSEVTHTLPFPLRAGTARLVAICWCCQKLKRDPSSVCVCVCVCLFVYVCVRMVLFVHVLRVLFVCCVKKEKEKDRYGGKHMDLFK